MKYIIPFLFTIFSFTFLQADSLLQSDLLDSALSKMHNMEYEESKEYFNKMAESDSNAYYAPLGKLLVERYQLIGIYGNNFDKIELIKKLDKLTEYYQLRLDQDPNNVDLNFCMALTIGFKSRILLSERNSLYILFNGIQSIKYLRVCNKLSTNNADVEFSNGVFEYYISKYPGIIKYFSKILLDNSGNKEIGISKIHFAAISDGFLKYDANFALAFIYLFIENAPEKAILYIDLLVNKFPNNPNYQFLLTFANLQLNNLEIAKINFENFKKAKDKNQIYYLKEFENRTQFLKAMIAMKNQNYSLAEQFFGIFSNNYHLELEHLLTITNLEKGKILDLAGDRKKAISYYKAVLKINNKTYPINLAKQYLKNPYTSTH